MFRFSLTAFAALFLLVAHVEAATYYTATAGNDSNAGTEQQPFRTVKRGVSVLKTGDTLYIRAGTYNEQLSEGSFTASGSSWTSPITVSSFPGETVILRPSTTSGNVAVFGTGTVSYLIINDLILDGISAGGGGGGSVFYCGRGTHDLRLTNVEIMNGDGNGVLCYGTTHEFRDLKVHHNGRSTQYTNSNGMYMVTDNTRIIGGEFYENECYGVRFFDSDTSQSADNNVVTNARIYKNGRSAGFGGTSQCGSGGGGIVLGDTNNMASNNVVFGNYWGFTTSYPSAMKLYNNTFYGNQYGVWIADGSNADARNNIVYQNGNSITNNASGTVLSNNLTSDPKFNDPARGDFSLRSDSPAIDAGVSLSAVKTDIRGVARPQGMAYDVGAYEGSSSVTTPPAAPTQLRVLR
jgi:parallel beta-helix repeat protein